MPFELGGGKCFGTILFSQECRILVRNLHMDALKIRVPERENVFFLSVMSVEPSFSSRKGKLTR